MRLDQHDCRLLTPSSPLLAGSHAPTAGPSHLLTFHSRQTPAHLKETEEAVQAGESHACIEGICKPPSFSAALGSKNTFSPQTHAHLPILPCAGNGALWQAKVGSPRHVAHPVCVALKCFLL